MPFLLTLRPVPLRISETNYEDREKGIRVTCAISKRYRQTFAAYWYGLHPPMLEFLQAARRGYFVLGCRDSDRAYAVPVELITQNLENLNRSKEGHWHIHLKLGELIQDRQTY
jgi:hypothetical protein